MKTFIDILPVLSNVDTHSLFIFLSRLPDSLIERVCATKAVHIKVTYKEFFLIINIKTRKFKVKVFSPKTDLYQT